MVREKFSLEKLKYTYILFSACDDFTPSKPTLVVVCQISEIRYNYDYVLIIIANAPGFLKSLLYV